MSVSVQEAAARRTDRALNDLIAAVTSTQADKVTWEPLENGRSALDQVKECVIANRKWADILRTRNYSNAPRDFVDQVSGLQDLEAVIGKLRETAGQLMDAIRALPDHALDLELDTPWGPYAIWDCCFHAYWNMVYHEGQINYIQTLYGDYEDHY